MSKQNKQSNQPASFNLKSTLFSLSSDAVVNISLWALISLPFKLLFRNLKSFISLSVPTAALLTICSILFKHGILCTMQENALLTSSLCNDNTNYFYGDLFIRFVILMFFVIKWYQIALIKTSPSLKNFFILSKKDFKSMAIMCFIMITNILPMFALLLLIIREPNPNWIIELGYFTSVAWLFLVPLIVLRFYSILAFSLEGRKIPSLKEIWRYTSGNNLKILLSAGTIVFLALFLFMQYSATMMQLTNITTFNFIVAEFEYNILITTFSFIYINYCHTQKLLLFKGETNEQ